MKVATKGIFPSQAVPDAEKSSKEYGLQVARAIEAEWFKRDSGSDRYYDMQMRNHELRSVSYTHLTLPTNREV